MAFTSGQVLTAAQLNDLSINSLVVDTNVLVVDKTNNRVGVGTTGPSNVFHVNGSTNNFVARFESTDSEVYVGLKDSATSSGGHVAIAAIGDDLVFRAGNSNAARLKSDGKLGIGTTAPETPLTITTTNKLGGTFTGTTDGEGLRVDQSNYSAGNYVSLVEASYDDGQTEPHVRIGAMFDGGGSHLAFGTTNNFGNGITNTALFIDQTGKIGINDTSPAQRLTVQGTTALVSKTVTGRDTFVQTPWSNATIALANFGSIGTQGSFKTTLAWNFERGTDSGFHSLGINSYTSAAAIELGNSGIEFRNNSSYGATSVPTRRMVMTDAALLIDSGVDYFATSPTTGTGNDAEWSSTGFGTYMLKRNSSLTAEKENITADLGTHLTADMIDSVVPKMWNRVNSPGYPEIGPLAEDMDAISPFLAVKGANFEGEEVDGEMNWGEELGASFLTGINKTAYLSLLVLAVKDLRTRVAALESA